MTSVSNLRLRETLNLPTKIQKTISDLSKFKSSSNDNELKKEEVGETLLSLDETKRVIKEQLGRDLRSTNPKTSEFSKTSWGSTGRWEEILNEGLPEKVNIIHEPSIEFGLRPDTICGDFKRYQIGPNNSALLFNLILSYAYKLIATNE